MTIDSLCHIGTSGWNYDHWEKTFYPEGSSGSELLDLYAQSFKTVEVNNSFYQLPEEKTLKNWRKTVPDNFKFSVKASRYITHMKKLKDPAEPVSNFMDRIKTLGNKLGSILFQLPPNWNFDASRLSSFLEVLPSGYDYAFEFRDPSWLNLEALDLLAKHEAAFCIYEYEDIITDLHRTTDFVYIRLHGPEGAYQGKYETKTLAGWAEDIIGWLSEGIEVYCYFDNDQYGYAPQNASELQKILREKRQNPGEPA